ncbi:MAG: hypothetical protein ACLQVI_21850 [Polyangiaceae bacterium]
MRSHSLRPARPARLAVLRFLLLVFLLTLARRANAQTWFDASQSRLEDRFADGDIDAEDLARIPAMEMRGRGSGGRGEGGGQLLAQSWISLVAFTRGVRPGLTDVGGFVVVGLALDKIVKGKARVDVRPSFADGPSPTDPPPRAVATAPDPPRLAIDAALARGAVRTAWRVSGIEVNDARIDSMIARSRLSAILPETRIRLMQVFQDGQNATSYVDEGGTLVNTSGTTTTLEARFTWRFDRLLFADDEPALERVRLEREEARGRIGTKVLELLLAWQRAVLDEADSDMGSKAEIEATLRRIQAELALDVLTGGWFGAQPSVRYRGPPPARPAATP